MMTAIFPFTAIVGQETFKLALLLNIIDPTLGGVLAIGDKGTGKTTLVRSLANLMANQDAFPFVNLPIGASEDSLLGQLSLGKLINEKQEHLQLGLLAKANRGFLYIDEINLLNDYLMDMLLDAASMGYYFLEREGFSKKLDSKFCLIGSMNPEEGDLRPQLKDRFGLCVFIQTPQCLEQRVKVIERRLAFDQDAAAFRAKYAQEEQELLEEVLRAKAALNSIVVSPEVLSYSGQLALNNQVEGLRADILLVKTARAFTALNGRTVTTTEDVDAIQHLVLNHRSNALNSSPPPPQEKEENKASQEKQSEPQQQAPNALIKAILPDQHLVTRPHNGGKSKNGTPQRQKEAPKGIAQTASAVKTIDKRKTVGQYLATSKLELKHKREETKTKQQLIFVLDSSGSMLQQQVIAYAKGLIKKWAKKQANSPTTFSLITLFDGAAKLQLEGSKDLNKLLEVVESVETGGKTNLVAAFRTIKKLTAINPTLHYQLIILSDGRFQSKEAATLEDLVLAYQMNCKLVSALHFVDAEQEMVKIGWGAKFAKQLKGTYEVLNIMK
ncbi:AAA family ATPase [Aureispira anguillae]|uniref:AAA family ATPase n=1 Tax=Aureispira anguillae TaxID=2864201 RepID=A0A915YDS1_9BACT|nr:AAA family ATPase [Aureispira anguillae]BDS11197.1 AAA family ATPase [Aureispira anguillae]